MAQKEQKIKPQTCFTAVALGMQLDSVCNGEWQSCQVSNMTYLLWLLEEKFLAPDIAHRKRRVTAMWYTGRHIYKLVPSSRSAVITSAARYFSIKFKVPCVFIENPAFRIKKLQKEKEKETQPNKTQKPLRQHFCFFIL